MIQCCPCFVALVLNANASVPDSASDKQKLPILKKVMMDYNDK